MTACFRKIKQSRLKEPIKADINAALFQWFTAPRAQSLHFGREIH